MPLLRQSLLMGLCAVIEFLPLAHVALEMGTDPFETVELIHYNILVNTTARVCR